MIALNRIYCCDCIEGMKWIDDKSIDMILCDLPYGTTACSWDTIIPFEPLWEQYEKIIKDNRAIVLFGSQPFTSALIMSNPKMFKYCWVWNKKQSGSFWLAKYQPLKITEDVIVFSKNGEKINYYPIMRRGKMRSKGGAKNPVSIVSGGLKTTPKTKSDAYFPTNILDFSNAGNKGYIHPTQKPVSLFEYLIKTYTNEGDLVLDNCMGSGTTAVACKQLKRNYIVFEINSDYCDMAKKRLEQVKE